MVFYLAAQRGSPPPKVEKIRSCNISLPYGSVSFPELVTDLGYLGDLKLESIGDSVGGPESIQLTATKQIDFGAAFNGAIIKSYAKNVKIKSVIGSYGSDQNTYVGAYALEGEL